jgi:hypothetical protein
MKFVTNSYLYVMKFVTNLYLYVMKFVTNLYLYVMKFVTNLPQLGGLLWVLRVSSTRSLGYYWYIVKSGYKHLNSNIS